MDYKLPKDLKKSTGITLSIGSDGVITFTNKPKKQKQSSLTPRQKAAWLRMNRPEKAVRGYEDLDKSDEAEQSNNAIGEIMDDLELKAMDMQFETREHIEEVLEQTNDTRVFVEDHIETYGTDEEMMNALNILARTEAEAVDALKSREKGEEAITSRKDL